MVEERIIKNITVDADSIELGSPTKGGKLKIYGDFTKKDEFKHKIECAIEVTSFALQKLGKLK